MYKPIKDNKKKYKLASNTDLWSVDNETLNKLYDWGIDSNDNFWCKDLGDGWNQKTTLPLAGSFGADPYNDAYHLAQQDAERIYGQFHGAIVRFAPTSYFNDVYTSLTIEPISGPDTSRLDDPKIFKGQGTVIDIDKKPNYKGQWHASILWSDGRVSYENLSDITIVFPRPEA